jgi:hypothetical protein
VAVAAPAPAPRPAARVFHARITISAVSTAGGLARDALVTAVGTEFPKLRACYERSLAHTRRRATPVFTVVLVFDRHGRVVQTALSDGGPPGLRACASEALRKIGAPVASGGDARARFELAFAPGS